MDAGVLPTTKVKDLTEAEVEKLRHEVAKYSVEGDLRRFKKFIEGPSVSKSVRHLRFAPRDVA